MAEPVSSIVTLAIVSLQIIRKTTNFIQDSRVVDTLVQKLQGSLQNLGWLIEIVDRASREAKTAEDDPFVQMTLVRCRDLLENVQNDKNVSDRSSNLCGARLDPGLDHTLRKAATGSFETFSDAETANESTTQTKSTFDKTPSRSSTSDSWKTTTEPQVSRDDHACPSTDGELSKDQHAKLHSLVSASKFDDTPIEAMKEMLQNHSDSDGLVNATDEYGRTPLHLAARRGDVKLGQALLDHGADINARDSDFRHPHSVLDIALAANRYSFAKLLLGNGADEGSVLKAYQSRLREIKAAIEEEKEAEARKTKAKRNRSRGGAKILRGEKEKRGSNCGATSRSYTQDTLVNIVR
ncbi:hypothetical protein SLS62_002611 [Diatrype stigma]|uniref:Ankyrin n=1 Tax=Diatrype stigma TaxID=117547 RepID=A0AAN9V6D2_9PEZI